MFSFQHFIFRVSLFSVFLFLTPSLPFASEGAEGVFDFSLDQALEKDSASVDEISPTEADKKSVDVEITAKFNEEKEVPVVETQLTTQQEDRPAIEVKEGVEKDPDGKQSSKSINLSSGFSAQDNWTIEAKIEMLKKMKEKTEAELALKKAVFESAEYERNLRSKLKVSPTNLMGEGHGIDPSSRIERGEDSGVFNQPYLNGSIDVPSKLNVEPFTKVDLDSDYPVTSSSLSPSFEPSSPSDLVDLNDRVRKYYGPPLEINFVQMNNGKLRIGGKDKVSGDSLILDEGDSFDGFKFIGAGKDFVLFSFPGALEDGVEPSLFRKPVVPKNKNTSLSPVSSSEQ